MTTLLDTFKRLWTHLLWFLAAMVLLVDPRHIFEWAHRHELWGGVITALWAILLAWAGKQRQQPQGATVTPPGALYATPPTTQQGMNLRSKP